MKKYFLFFNLFFLLFVAWTWSASAAKKYRYIKREHGVRFEGSVPMEYSSTGFKASTNLKGAYAYNWGGMFEFGPYVDLGLDFRPYALKYWGGGLMAEYNFVKNRGRKKYVPAIGLSFGATQNQDLGVGLHLAGGIHGALKIFVGTRTPFTVILGYRALTPSSQFGKALTHSPYLSMGFSYYFDFY